MSEYVVVFEGTGSNLPLGHRQYIIFPSKEMYAAWDAITQFGDKVLAEGIAEGFAQALVSQDNVGAKLAAEALAQSFSGSRERLDVVLRQARNHADEQGFLDEFRQALSQLGAELNATFAAL